MKTICLLLAIAVCLPGCRVKKAVDYFSQEPDGEPVRQVLTTGAMLGFAVAATMRSIGSQQPLSYVSVAQTVSSYPGAGLVYVDPPDNQTLPPGIDAATRIAVAGFWSDTSSAVLTVAFINGDLKLGGTALTNISTFPVVKTDSSYLLVFAYEDVNSGTSDTAVTFTLSPDEVTVELTRLTSRPSIDTTISVDQRVWIVEVSDNQTADDLFDDSYSIIGAGQHVGLGFSGEQLTGGEILQLVMVACRMQLPCRSNPVEGWGMVRKFGAEDVNTGKRSQFGTSVWWFHDTCDGKARIVAATGTYVGFSGRSVDLRLN